MNRSLPRACKAVLKRHLDPELFRALCEPNRMVLLANLCMEGQPMTVGGVSKCCGIHLSGVSRHLSVLKRAGVVVSEKRGREVSYRLDYDRVIGALRGLADAIEACRPRSEAA